MRGIWDGDEMASTTTCPLRVSGRGGMSIRGDSSKGGAEASVRGAIVKAPRVVGAKGRKCRSLFILRIAKRDVRISGHRGQAVAAPPEILMPSFASLRRHQDEVT
jgi:hypothetical protein